MKILIILTQQSQSPQKPLKITKNEDKTGYVLEEFAAPYSLFQETDVNITLASPKTVSHSNDSSIDGIENIEEVDKSNKFDENPLKMLSQTLKSENIGTDGFDAVFFPNVNENLWNIT